MGTVRYTVLNGRVHSENRGGVEHSYSLDPLGNTRVLYDNTQTKTDTFDYFPSGTVASRTGTNPTPFQWNGGSGYFTDSSTRKYVRARNYFNSTGRWGSQDPIGFKAGDFNLYRYVGNRFVTAQDPSGLSPLPCLKWWYKEVCTCLLFEVKKDGNVIQKDAKKYVKHETTGTNCDPHQKYIQWIKGKVTADGATTAMNMTTLPPISWEVWEYKIISSDQTVQAAREALKKSQVGSVLGAIVSFADNSTRSFGVYITNQKAPRYPYELQCDCNFWANLTLLKPFWAK